MPMAEWQVSSGGVWREIEDAGWRFKVGAEKNPDGKWAWFVLRFFEGGPPTVQDEGLEDKLGYAMRAAVRSAQAVITDQDKLLV